MGEHVTAVTDAEFQVKVLESSKPVLVDFWATWCAPCRMIAPVVEELASELGEQVTVLKMDVDANPSIPRELGIMSIPTVIIFKDGKPAERTMGYKPSIKKDLRQKLDALLVSER
jgi:thioredoxin